MVERKEFKADDIGPGGGEIEFLNPDGDALETDAPATFRILKQDGSLLKKATLDDSNVIDLEDVTERQIKLVFDASGDSSSDEDSGNAAKSDSEEDSGEDESSGAESGEGKDTDSESSEEDDTAGEDDGDSGKPESDSTDEDGDTEEAGKDGSGEEEG